GVDVRFRMEQVPQPVCAQFRQGVLDVDRTTRAQRILSGVLSFDALPARVVVPLVLQQLDLARIELTGVALHPIPVSVVHTHWSTLPPLLVDTFCPACRPSHWSAARRVQFGRKPACFRGYRSPRAK